jgi:hypothetical protein
MLARMFVVVHNPIYIHICRYIHIYTYLCLEVRSLTVGKVESDIGRVKDPKENMRHAVYTMIDIQLW